MVLDVHHAGLSHPQIVKTLQKAKVNKMFVKRTLDHFKETGDTLDRPFSGHPRTACTSKAIKVIRQKI